MKEVQARSGVFEGDENALVFSNNIDMLVSGKYKMMGKLVAISSAQDGPGLYCMAKPTYRFWVGLNVPDDMLKIELIPDLDIREKVQKVKHF